MRVRVRDRSSETWGKGLFHVVVRTVDIPDTCPTCGGPRGTPRNANYYEDGESFSVDVWTNPCGHIDMYADVLKEQPA